MSVIKVCGITRLADARHAVAQGATALGFVFWPDSPRYIDPDCAGEIIAALTPGTAFVGVFVNAPPAVVHATVARAGLTAVQLHGDEPPDMARALGGTVWRSIGTATPTETLARWPADTVFLLDAADPVRRGGTGHRVDWTAAAAIARRARVVLAGGLTPDTVADAIAQVRPFGVDVSSGVEDAPGIKNYDKVTRFVAHARSAFGER